MNRTILILLVSDVLFFTGFGFIDPILAIFINDNLVGGSIFSAGLASAIFLVTKSLVQLPFSRYVDSHDNTIRFLLLGAFFVTATPFIYIFTDHVTWIYVAQFVYGVGSGLMFPTWLRLWTTHLDKHHESYEWSLYSTSVGVGTALSATIGATLAEFLGFEATFLIVGIFSLLGSLVLFGLERKRMKKTLEPLSRHLHARRKIVG